MAWAELLRIFSTALLNLSLAGLFGVMLCGAWLSVDDASSRILLYSRLSRFALAFTGLCMMALLWVAWASAAIMSDSALPDAGMAIQTMLEHTGVGHAMLASLVILMALLFVLTRPDLMRPRTTRLISIVLLLLFAYSRAAASHAAEHGLLSLPIMIDWLHLVAMAVWVGVVIVPGWLILPAYSKRGVAPAVCARLLPAVSRSATIALAVIIATGIFNAWRGLGTASNLVGNPYGTALSIKLLFVAGAIGLGGFNRFLGFPAVLRTPNPSEGALRRVIAVLRLESVVLSGALAAAAVLVGQAPPA